MRGAYFNVFRHRRAALGYDCVIPVDGLIARGDYEHEFTLHQFTILPGGAAQKFKVTQFEKIRIA
jgi:hypothetical protein